MKGLVWDERPELRSRHRSNHIAREIVQGWTAYCLTDFGREEGVELKTSRLHFRPQYQLRLPTCVLVLGRAVNGWGG